jgi:hypothetical protein
VAVSDRLSDPCIPQKKNQGGVHVAVSDWSTVHTYNILAVRARARYYIVHVESAIYRKHDVHHPNA